jgi:hypothetical protein
LPRKIPKIGGKPKVVNKIEETYAPVPKNITPPKENWPA